jgi:hypothetical protein
VCARRYKPQLVSSSRALGIHGAGEAIRGTINDTLDGLGDGVAGRERGTVQSHGNHDSGVAQRGIEEIKEGMQEAQTGKQTSSTVRTPRTHSLCHRSPVTGSGRLQLDKQHDGNDDRHFAHLMQHAASLPRL